MVGTAEFREGLSSAWKKATDYSEIMNKAKGLVKGKHVDLDRSAAAAGCDGERGCLIMMAVISALAVPFFLALAGGCIASAVIAGISGVGAPAIVPAAVATFLFVIAAAAALTATIISASAAHKYRHYS